MKTNIVVCAIVSVFSLVSSVLGQGGLIPPGAPAATMKTLTQVEPRTDVLTLPGNGNNQYLITQSGSYYLTTNIVGVASKNGINIQADNVTLDLNGFTLFGGATNSEAGIMVVGQHAGLVIRNGAVSGWAGTGIAAANAGNSEFEHLRDMTNGSVGIRLGSGNRAANCISIGNADDGMNIGTNCTVTGCTANANGISGIDTGDSCIIKDSTACGNTDDAGFSVGNYSHIAGCVASGNYIGANLGNACDISDCLVTAGAVGIQAQNSCQIEHVNATSNSIYGFYVYGGNNRVKDNTSSFNETGIDLESNYNRVEGNMSSFDGTGIFVDLAVENIIYQNTVTAAVSTAYNIPSGNMVGVIVAAPTSGAINGSSGGTGLGTSNPWANFSY